jgi:hypothetical protein
MHLRGAPIFCLVLAACAPSPSIVLQDLSGSQNLRRFTLQWVHGVRDGDRMPVRVLISNSSSVVTLDLHFAIGVPTTLESGTWSWSFQDGGSREGTVAARSVKFLGGQDGPPSIGGTFDLTGPGGYAYRVTIPLTELPRSFRPSASGPQHH